MKQLEITTNKRLLIVEYEKQEELDFLTKIKITHLNYNGKEIRVKVICKGSDIAEDIARGFAKNIPGFNNFYYCYQNSDIFYRSPLESFISAIESNGWYWGENPLEKEVDSLASDNTAIGCAKYRKAFHEWQEAESRTFNPEKCLIVEIV